MTLSESAAATPTPAPARATTATAPAQAPVQPAPIVTDPRIRVIAPTDVARTVDLIYELAVYEKLPEECHITPEQLQSALFGEHPALFGLAAFESEAADAAQVGYALYFLNFSTWEGVHGVYLEDVYVTPEQRGTGLGRALLESLAATAVDRGYARVEWSVLDWNAPSIAFYQTLGAVPMQGWTVYRLTGDALRHTGRLRRSSEPASATSPRPARRVEGTV